MPDNSSSSNKTKAKSLRVGKYILKETLGTGFFAEVKLGVHVDSGRKYAIKIIDKRKVPLKDLERQIKREVKIMQYLRHDFIVSVHQVLMSGTRMYLVMDYVSGGELFDLIVKRQRVSEEDSRRYFQQLVDAVSYCHAKGVYHRDLKPENLLLDHQGDLKITDFGMSFLTENATDAADTLLHTHCGTPEYMAPELASRSPCGYRGDKLDVWSCGVILFVLLAGGLPFSGKNDTEIFNQISRKKIIYPSWFSTEVSDLLDGLLLKDANDRISLDEVKNHPWFAVDYIPHPSTSGPIKTSQTTEEPDHEISPNDYLMDVMSPTGMLSPRGASAVTGPATSAPANAEAVAAALQNAMNSVHAVKSPNSITGDLDSLAEYKDDEPAPTSVRTLFGKKTKANAAASINVSEESPHRSKKAGFLLSPRSEAQQSVNSLRIKSSGSRQTGRGFNSKKKIDDCLEEKSEVIDDQKTTPRPAMDSIGGDLDEVSSTRRRQMVSKLFNRKKGDILPAAQSSADCAL